MSETLAQQLALLPEYLSRHLLLSVTALATGISLSLPIALFVVRSSRLSGPVLAIASAIQTIPGLALLALMVPILGRIGFLPAVIALVLYSALPILRNTVTGIRDVDRDLIEAGLGLGMTQNQLLFKVQLPLALPLIVAGIRTATVWVVGLATLSTPVGATSLGNYIFSGLQTQNYTAVLVGCIGAAALAILLDGLIRLIEIALAKRDRRMIGAAIAATASLFVAGLWPAVVALQGDSRPAVVIGAKTFTEQYILARVIATELEAAGFRTQTLDSLGSTVAFDALADGQIDSYVDYTGTIWANYMNRDDNPGREEMLNGVSTWLDEEHDIELIAALGFENAYALAMTSAHAEALGIRTIDDLVRHAPDLRMGGDYEFFGRPEWRELESRYELRFEELVTMDSTLMYSAVAAGEVDVITAFSSDGRISAFELTLLEDPRRALPPYDAVVLLSRSAAEQQPDLRQILGRLAGTIDVDEMRAANQHVDLDGGTVNAAAALLTTQIRTQLR